MSFPTILIQFIVLSYSCMSHAAPNEECVVLENPDNGRVIMNGTQIGNTVSYECDTGFTLVGESIRTCNLVGLWTDRQPVCQSEFYIYIYIYNLDVCLSTYM